MSSASSVFYQRAMGQHTQNWIEASVMLRKAMERYRDKNRKKSLSEVLDDVIDYIYEQTEKELDKKTIRRDLSNKSESKKLHPIPNWRVEIYAKWLYEQTLEDRKWIEGWLTQTAYPSPGKLVTEVYDGEPPTQVKTNVPPLRKYLWGNFLGRQAEIAKLQQWADQQRYPTAVLCGFGGNGKTTIQLKIGTEFVYGVTCPLRWPYEGAVWVSAVDYPRGQPTLLDVLRKVAGTFELFDKEINLEQVNPDVITNDVKELLEEHRILILLDNFETVSPQNQIEILEFLANLRGSSQTLISTRYRPDWFLEQEQDTMYSMAHVLIRIEGLSTEDAELLIQDFLNARSLPQNTFTPEEIKKLSVVTHNNPKSILAVLGLVEQGMSLVGLLDAITDGKPEADQIFERIIDKAWKEILTESDRAVLMAKALFSHSAAENNLGQVAGVTDEQLRQAIKKLAAISFFELERTKQHELRIRTHPLAQDFARRVLRNYSEFENKAEELWWQKYAVIVLQKAGQTAYTSIKYEMTEDVKNVVERIEKHIRDRSFYSHQAANLFGKSEGGGGIGFLLRHWGWGEELLRLANLVLNFAIEHQNPELIGECALRLLSREYRTRGDFDKADEYISLAVEQNTILKDRCLSALIDAVRAALYRRRGYLGAAEQFYRKALQGFMDVGHDYYIAKIYSTLGGVTVAITTQNLEEATDIAGKTNEQLNIAEKYFSESEKFWVQKVTDWSCQFELTNIIAWRGIIARVRGQLDEARNLFQNCIGKFQSLLNIARLYRELALVENLSGNRQLSHDYDEKGLRIFQQLEIGDNFSNYHCYRVIDRMKQEGTW